MKKILLILVLTCSITTIWAQDQKAFSHFNIALRASTTGVGLEAATPLHKNFNARAGFNFIGFNTGYHNFDLDDNNNELYDAIGFIPNYRMKAKFNLAHGHLLADYHPLAKGIFHITAGVYLGSNKTKAKGFLSDENNNMVELQDGFEWPILDFDGHEINTEGGRIDLDLRLGNAIKPYLGFGLGHAVTQKRLGFKFELGVLYQGDYSLKQNGKKVSFSDTEINNFQDVDKYTKWLKWWPMLNFQLTYNIF